MARIRDTTGVAQTILNDAARWYANPSSIPKTFDRVHPLVMETAMELARGDIHRLIIEDDLGVTVMNRPVWS